MGRGAEKVEKHCFESKFWRVWVVL